MTVNEKQVAHFMRALGISREEALQLIQDDNNDVSVDLTSEQKKTAKAMAQGDRKIETKPRNRERKVDETKKRFLNGIRIYLEGCGASVNPLTNETDLHFNFENATYSIKLIKHRK